MTAALLRGDETTDVEIWHELVGRPLRLVGLQRAELNGWLGTVSTYNSTTKVQAP